MIEKNGKKVERSAIVPQLSLFLLLMTVLLFGKVQPASPLNEFLPFLLLLAPSPFMLLFFRLCYA
ncbi:hypothetical protein F5H01DRAFT_356716 [Linnemannia elongata]|nr:hypothetical protein F5H01DRAFT_356716 [Linnemannia elongata]